MRSERCRVFFWIKRWVRPVSLSFPAWEQLKCPSTEEWIKKVRHTYMMDYLLLFSHSVMSDSLWPYGLWHIRLPWPSPSPGVCSNSCPFSWWCHPNTLSSIIAFCYIVLIVQMTTVSEILKTSFREKTHPCHPRSRTVIPSVTGPRIWSLVTQSSTPALSARHGVLRAEGQKSAWKRPPWSHSDSCPASRQHRDLESSQSGICPIVTVTAISDL